MKILVTGVSGFIGGRIAERLTQTGHEVVGTGRKKESGNKNRFTYKQLDLQNPEQCLQLLESSDAVVHCAGKAGAWGSHADYVSANVEGTRNLLEAARKKGVKRFINLSSPSLYFDYKDQLNLSEANVPSDFSNSYAQTKFEAEKLVESANGGPFTTISLRPRGVIGAGDQNWLPRIIDLRKKNKLIQPGQGTNTTDFTSIENLLDAIELSLTTSAQNCGRAYNITNGEPIELWNFIEKALTQLGLDGKRKKIPMSIAMTAARISEHYHRLRKTKKEPTLLPIKVGVAGYSMTLDISAARTRLGYRPRVSTSDGLSEFTEWWKEGR